MNTHAVNKAKSTALDSARTGQEQKTIDISSIKANPLNPYSMEEHIERLAASIATYGLLQPLVVYDNDVTATSNKSYTLISGESRLTAINSLSEDVKAKKFPRNLISVIVIPKPRDKTDELILIHEANLAGRDMTASEKLKRVTELNDLYQSKCSSAEAAAKLTESLKMSDRMLRKYKAANTVIPELKKDIDNQKLSISMAAIVSQIPKDAQVELHEILSQYRLTEAEIKEFASIKKEKEALAEKLDTLESDYRSSQEQIAALQKIIKDSSTPDTLKQAAEEKLEAERALKKQISKEIAKTRTIPLEPSQDFILSRMLKDIEATKKRLEYFRDNGSLIEANPNLASSIKALAKEIEEYIP